MVRFSRFVLTAILATVSPIAAQVSLSPQVAATGGVLTAPIVFGGASAAVGALQFDVSHDADISLSAVSETNKTVYAFDLSPSLKRFVIAGMDEQALPSGTLLNLVIAVASGAAPGSSALSFSNIVASTPDGSAIPLSAQSGGLTIQPGAPAALTAYGVVNAASWSPGPIAPGEIITLVGTGLGPAGSGPVSDTVVLVNGAPAPVLYAAAGQINAVVPFEVAGHSSAQITVTYQNNTVAQTSVPVAPAAPGIFSLAGSGLNQGAVLNQDFQVNSADNPAARGSTIEIYATGGGAMNPAALDGQVISSLPLPQVVLPVSVTIGGIPALVSYAGAAPGFIAGALQVNCQVPPNVAPGNAVTVFLQIGGMLSQSGLTMAIQ
jgi:uncharacterized protein (TIGR03437 family)